MAGIGTKIRYFKIPLCRIFLEMLKSDQGQVTRVNGALGQKLGYDRQDESEIM